MLKSEKWFTCTVQCIHVLFEYEVYYQPNILVNAKKNYPPRVALQHQGPVPQNFD